MKRYLEILKGEYKNPHFYLYLVCWLPAMVIISQGNNPWWSCLIVLVQLPFCFPLVVQIENPERSEPLPVDNGPRGTWLADGGRYEAMPDKGYGELAYKVWDYYENGVVAYCPTELDANDVAEALNKNTKITWDSANKCWVGDEQTV